MAQDEILYMNEKKIERTYRKVLGMYSPFNGDIDQMCLITWHKDYRHFYSDASWASAFINFMSKWSITHILQIKTNVGKTAFIDIKPNWA